jgi:hypothetical protein
MTGMMVSWFKNNGSRIGTIIILLVCIIVLSSDVTKARFSSFTHDESFSYLRFVPHSIGEIISGKDAFANNHVLNTICMKGSEKLLGNSELALRLPNLLMLIVYFIYTFLFFRKTGPVLFVSMFVIMTTNIPLNDFFGLARGYGLSIGFMMMSLYHLVNSFKDNNDRQLLLFNLAAFLAIASNYSMIMFYMAALLVFNLILIMDRLGVRRLIRLNHVNIIFFLLFVVILFGPVKNTLRANAYDSGGQQDFIRDTLSSIIYHVFTNVHRHSPYIIPLQIIIIFVLSISLLVTIRNTRQGNKAFYTRSRALMVVNLVFLTIAMETTLLHWVLKTDYLIGRFALFLLVLFILNIGFLMEYFLDSRFRTHIQILAVVLALLSVSNFYINRKPYSVFEWEYDSETKNAVLALIRDHQNDEIKKDTIKIGNDWVFEPTLNFYRQTWNIRWLLPADREGLTERDDYEYILNDDPGKLKNKNYSVIFSSEQSNTMLIKINP